MTNIINNMFNMKEGDKWLGKKEKSGKISKTGLVRRREVRVVTR